MAFSPIAAQQINNSAHRGALENATHVGKYGNRGDGPYVTLWLHVEGEKIVKATYETYGCPSVMACAGLTCEMLKGRTIHQALSLEPNDLILVLGGLPEGKGECADFVIQALRNAFQPRGEN